MEFELPEDQTYYAVPYLLPTRGGKYEFRSNVRYGNTIKLPYFNGYIDEFKQESYSKNGDKYTFKCHAHAIYNPKDDEFWKLYYEDDNGEKVFFDAKTYEEPSVTAPNSAEFEFEIELESNLFKDGKKDIKLGIATFTESYFVMLASDPQIFELSTDRWVDLGLPSGILWAAYNVGATSPEEYGGYYAWGETKEKSSYTFMNYEHGYFGGYDSEGYAIISYNDLGGNISNTIYDAAKANWDGEDKDDEEDNDRKSARMPTFKEMEELAEYCKFENTSLNGTLTAKVTGPNGNSIYIPFASGKSDGFNGEGGGVDDGVFIWSSEEMADNPGYAYCLGYRDGYVDLYGICPREFGISVRAVKDKEED